MERSKKPSAIPVSPTIPTPQVSISDDNSRVTASLPTGESVEVLLFGATVLSWKTAKGKENLFVSSKAHLDGSKAVRGGIPLVFPNFGPSSNKATEGLPQHGFARTTKWEYLGKSSSESSTLPNSSGDSSVKLDFGLSNAMLDKIPSEWKNYQFGITYSVTLGRDDLETSLAIRNTGEKDFEFQTLLHSYWAVDNISDVSVSGLEKISFADKVGGGKEEESGAITVSSEVDRVYHVDPSQGIAISEKDKPRFEFTRDMLPDYSVLSAKEPIDNGYDGLLNIGLHDFAHDSASQQHLSVRRVKHDVDDEKDFPTPQDEEKPQRPSILPRPSSIARHASFLDEDEAPPTSPSPPSKSIKRPGPVAWRDLPKKSQLAILTLARLSEPLTQTSLQAYMFYQLKSFNPSLPSSTISAQAGMLQGSFTAAQFVTAILWGRMADAEWGGVIVGPILGGLLSDPVRSYPSVFGAKSVFGGENGVWWLKHWPYALPNLMSAIFLFISAMGVVLGLEETLEAIRDQPDQGLRLGHFVANAFRYLSRRNTHHYTAINSNDDPDSPTNSSRLDSYELESRLPKSTIHKPKPRRKLPLSRIWTRNVLCTFLCHSILALHIGTFNNLWFIHLSAPRFDPENPSPPSHTQQSLPFSFTGGLGMPPRSVGFAMAVLGLIGISLQLLVYPAVNARLGTLRSFRYSLCLFPLAYTLTPYLSIIHSSLAPPNQASGILVWLSLSCVLLVQVVGRTFALPANIILINNCSPHPSVLGTIHGVAQSVSSASRTIGPVLGGWGYGKGLQVGIVGAVWWALAVVAALGWLLSGLVREGDGHEIWLEGEKEEEEGGNEEVG
ncbi:MAG: hypothetical protein ASARMPRED_004532 [Alectoria sarmentosa]|nr:MAG: hypothetical protein ASARMPRED_004532 [Alectoria sarmentosa]